LDMVIIVVSKFVFTGDGPMPKLPMLNSEKPPILLKISGHDSVKQHVLPQ